VLKGAGARLQRALITWMLDLHISKHGYTEIYPPYLVKKECLYGAGQLPKFAENIYHDAEDDLWMVGTAEIPLTNLHRDEVLDAAALPLSYVAYTACFRREKMSAGRDVRGIKRGHQFDKVEMYKFVAPEASAAALEEILGHAEDVARGLGLPHRVVSICTGDLGFVAAKSTIWRSGRRAATNGSRLALAATAPTFRRGAPISATAPRRAPTLPGPSPSLSTH